jgi:hypothetical protein
MGSLVCIGILPPLPPPHPPSPSPHSLAKHVNKICIERQCSTTYVFSSLTNGKVYCTWNKYTLCKKTILFV